jgi:hypothetical protein
MRMSRAAQEHGVDEGEVDGEDRLGLRGEELAPGRPGPMRSGVDASGPEDHPHGGGGHMVAESVCQVRRCNWGLFGAVQVRSTRDTAPNLLPLFAPRAPNPIGITHTMGAAPR